MSQAINAVRRELNILHNAIQVNIDLFKNVQKTNDNLFIQGQIFALELVQNVVKTRMESLNESDTRD
jgi:hypothetical protein